MSISIAIIETYSYNMPMDKDLLLLQNHIRDLAERSFMQGVYTFTDFLSLAQLDVFYQLERELSYAHPSVFGGYEGSERCLVRFGSEELLGYDQPYPIVCLHIRPLMDKYADALTHRDYLGALMNLGIERGTLGDIRSGEKEAYLFCLETMANYICEGLTKVKHTSVTCTPVTDLSSLPIIKSKEVCVTVSSLRADSLIAKVFNLSRQGAQDLFTAGCIYVNGRQTDSPSKTIAPGDSITARGYGKFTISPSDEPRQTKKGKLSVVVNVFI